MKSLSGKSRTILATVARRAGVCIVTASRALKAHPLVARATRGRILAAQTELDYAPNLLARGLVQYRTATADVAIPELANPFFVPMAAVRAAGIPVIVMAWPWPDGDYVATDDLQGGRLAAQHLLTRAHRRIGIVRMADPRHAPIQARVQGFREVLAAAGTSVQDTWDVQVPGTQIEDSITAADRVLTLPTRPSALFVSSDRIAIGITHRLLARGVRVPEDIALVSYDDIPYAMPARVPLTTVAVPKRSLGEKAANLLFERYDGKGSAKPRQILLPPELVVRLLSMSWPGKANRMLKNSSLFRLRAKVKMQGAARSEARGVLHTYVAAPRERGNAADGPFSAAC